MRNFSLVCVAVVLLTGAARGAEPVEDTASAVMAECSESSLPAASVDSCLERVRILEESDTSPDLSSLEARLDARVASDHEPIGPSPGGSAPVEERPYSASPAGEGNALGAESGSENRAATAAPRSLERPDEPRAASADSAAAEADEAGSSIPDDQADQASPASAAADAPPAVGSDDEPPIADPPDSSAAGDEDSGPPG